MEEKKRSKIKKITICFIAVLIVLGCIVFFTKDVAHCFFLTKQVTQPSVISNQELFEQCIIDSGSGIYKFMGIKKEVDYKESNVVFTNNGITVPENKENVDHE